MMNLQSEMNRALISHYGWQVGVAVVTLVIGWLVARAIRSGMRRSLELARMDATLASFLTSLAYVAMLVLVIIAALHRLGFPTVSFAAVIGAAGLAVGLALKGTLSNFASGVILISLRPFKVGDRIEAAGVTGVVKQIQIFSTTIEADDGHRVIIPNAKIANEKISNFSSNA